MIERTFEKRVGLTTRDCSEERSASLFVSSAYLTGYSTMSLLCTTSNSWSNLASEALSKSRSSQLANWRRNNKVSIRPRDCYGQTNQTYLGRSLRFRARAKEQKPQLDRPREWNANYELVVRIGLDSTLGINREGLRKDHPSEGSRIKLLHCPDARAKV